MVVDQEPVVPSPQMVGREFVRQYYTMMGDSPQQVYRFYSNESVYVFNANEPAIGQLGISERIEMLKLRDCHTKIRALDSYETLGRAVVVQVIGDLSINAGVSRRFAQTFVLAPQSEKKYYVHNNIFRYLDELFDKDTEVPNMHSSVDMFPVVNGNAHEDELNNNSRLQMPICTMQMGPQQQPLPPRSSTENANRFTQDSLTQVASSMLQPINLAAEQSSSADWSSTKVASGTIMASPQPHQANVATSQISSTTNSPVFYVPQAPLNQQSQSSQSFPAPLPPRSIATIDEVRRKQSSGSGADPSSGNALDASNSSVTESPPEELRRCSSSAPIKIDSTLASGDQQYDVSASTSPKDNVAPSWANKVAGKKQGGQVPKAARVNNTTNGQTWSGNLQSPPQQQSQTQPSETHQQASRESPAPSSSGLQNGGSDKFFPTGSNAIQPNRGRGHLHKELSSANLFVSNLPEDILEEELRGCFSSFGNLTSIEIRKRLSNMPNRPFPSFAFVMFEDIATACRVLDARQSLFIREGHPVFVNPKRDERNQRSTDRTGGGSGSADRNYGCQGGAHVPRNSGGGRNQGGRAGMDPRGPHRGGGGGGGGGGPRGTGGNAPRTFTQSSRGGGTSSGLPHYYNAAPPHHNAASAKPT